MVLVKPKECQTIQDLEVLLIRKFGYPEGTAITLSVDGFCLPSTESIYLLSKDDVVHVCAVEDVIRHRKSKKRHTGIDESPGYVKSQENNSSPLKTPGTETVNAEVTLQDLITETTQEKVKKSKKKHKLPKSPVNAVSFDGADSPKVKRIKKRKKRHLENVKSPEPRKKQKFHTLSATEAEGLQSLPTSTIKSKPDIKKSPKFHQKQNIRSSPNCKEKFALTSCPDKGSDHTTSHVIEDHSKSSNTLPAFDTEKHGPQEVSSSQSRPSLVISTPKPSQVCETDHDVGKLTKINCHKQKRKSAATATCMNGNKSHIKFDSSSSSSDEESDLKLNTPKLSTWLNTAKASINCTKQTWSAKNLKDPGVSTNVSSIYTNPTIPNQTAESQSSVNIQMNETLGKNYVAMLPSTWPPRVGDIIAYQVLELSVDYTPVVSEYKEAKIQQVMSKCSSPIGVDSVQVELLTPKTTIKRDGGRYEMDIDEETDDESSETTAVLEWQTLLQPKLVQ